MNLILIFGLILLVIYLGGYLDLQESFGRRHHRLRNIYDIYDKSEYRNNPYEINNDHYGMYPLNYASHPHAYMFPLRNIH